MTVQAIVGANWGDEGKGKLTHALAQQADFVVRFQGGRNAGHTVVEPRGTFVLHLLPVGALHAHVCNVLGPGVARDLQQLRDEVDALQERGLASPKLAISDRAQVVLPHHPLLDNLEEKRLGSQRFGSTRSGIAPFYADKARKIGVQVADLFEPQRLRARVEAALLPANVLLRELYGVPSLRPDSVVAGLLEHAAWLQPLVCDTTELLHDGLEQGKRILLEGQLGSLRDPDHGIYPFTTSSSTLAGYGSVGAGLPPGRIDEVLAVAKAYSTCVGTGPFVTELSDETASQLRERGGEYGATTGRPRRIGWFDAVATRHGARAQGADALCLTMLDVLADQPELPVCVAYLVDGTRVERFVPNAKLERATPIYESLPGFGGEVCGVRRFEQLPHNARRYVRRIEELTQTPVRLLSTGPQHDALIEVPPLRSSV